MKREPPYSAAFSLVNNGRERDRNNVVGSWLDSEELTCRNQFCLLRCCGREIPSPNGSRANLPGQTRAHKSNRSPQMPACEFLPQQFGFVVPALVQHRECWPAWVLARMASPGWRAAASARDCPRPLGHAAVCLWNLHSPHRRRKVGGPTTRVFSGADWTGFGPLLANDRRPEVAFQPSVTLFLQGEQGVFRPASRGVHPCRSIIYCQSTSHSTPKR
jgi:hypothetical protein